MDNAVCSPVIVPVDTLAFVPQSTTVRLSKCCTIKLYQLNFRLADIFKTSNEENSVMGTFINIK
jgi:hypothetical protein